MVNGNGEYYVHPMTDRFLRPACMRFGDLQIEVRVKNSLFDTHLLELTLVAGAPPRPFPRPTMFDIVNGFDAGDEFMPFEVPTGFRLEVDSFVHLTGGLLLRTPARDRIYAIDVPTMRAVAAKLTTVPRDGAGWKQALWYCRREYEAVDFASTGFPVASAVTATAAIAFTNGVWDQVELTQTMMSRFGTAFNLYNAALTLTPLRTIHYGLIVGALLTSLVFVSFTFAEVPYEHHLAGWTLLFCVILAVITAGCCVCVNNQHRFWRARLWAGSAQEGNPLFIGDNAILSLEETLLSGNNLHASADEADSRRLEEGEFVRIGVDPRPPTDVRPIPRLIVEGMVTHQPVVVHEPSQESELAAIHHRYLLDTPVTLAGELDELVQALETGRPWEALREYAIYNGPDLFERWLMRPKTPEHERNKMRLARESLRQQPICDADFQCDMFVKTEKALKRKGKPRAITALSDRMKAYLTPPIYWFCNGLRAMMDGEEDRPLFSSSRSTEQIGEYLFQCWESVPTNKRLLFWNDQVKYDAHCREAYHYIVGGAMLWAGVEAKRVQTWKETLPKGRTPHGISFKLNTPILLSGRPDTNDGGSLYGSLTTDRAIVKSGSRRVGLVVNGDDGGGVISAEGVVGNPAAIAALQAKIRESFVDLGLTSEFTLLSHPWEFEYCSAILLPVFAGGRKTWKLTGLPGRIFSKMGYRQTSAQNSNLAQDVASLHVDFAHCPFVRVLLRRYAVLLRGVKPKGTPQEWDWKSHAAHVSVLDEEEAWMWMRERYGLSVSDEVALASYLAGVKSLPCVVEHYVITRLIDVDVHGARPSQLGGAQPTAA
jgi:hypothetical protein